MENSLIESLILPWWKIPVYILTVALGTIAIRVSVKFDINAWLKTRKESKELRDRGKASERCPHIWTLYPHSPYSRCDRCLVLISTSLLTAARAHGNPRPVISGQMVELLMKPGENDIITVNYMGARH